MKKIDDIKLHPSNTIKEAMAIIDRGSVQFAVIVDDDLKLLGVLTDGDIRSTLLRQVATAVSDGAIAALSVKNYLKTK